MKVTKTEIRFKTGFQQPKTGLPKKSVLTSLFRTQGTKHTTEPPCPRYVNSHGNLLHDIE